MIKSFDKRFLAGILALVFMLIMTLPDVTLSLEEQARKQGILRKASLQWMQVGMDQYRSDQFTEAEVSFRRALVFKKYLTEAERQQLDEFVANTSIALSEGKQAVANIQTADQSVEPNQPVKAAAIVEKVEAGQTPAEKGLEKIIAQPTERKEPAVKVAEPNASKIQLAAESSNGIVVVKDQSFSSKLNRLSAWLTQNRRNILMIGLPTLAVLIFISKLQGRRKRPGRRVYRNHVPANTSYIGSRLNGNGENSRAVKKSKNRRSAPAAVEKPERKSFTQSTEHWKEKHSGHVPADVKPKPFQTSEKWPQRKDKFEDENPAVTKDGQKQCSKCKEFKDLSDFHKDKSCKDGLASWCKDCKAIAARENRKKRAAEKN